MGWPLIKLRIRSSNTLLEEARRSWKVCSGGLRKPRVVTWMTRTFHVSGHRSPKLPPFFTVIVRRVPLPRTCSTIFVVPGCAINQSRIDVEEVDEMSMCKGEVAFLSREATAKAQVGSQRKKTRKHSSAIAKGNTCIKSAEGDVMHMMRNIRVAIEMIKASSQCNT